MPISVAPGTGGFVPGTENSSVGAGLLEGLGNGLQLIAQAKQHKEAKAQKQQEDALEQLKTLTSLAQQGLPVDPDALLKIADQAFPGAGVGKKGPSVGGSPISQVAPQTVAATGGAMQGVQNGGQAGAQAANPPSRSAAAKAPGDGVTKPALSANDLQHWTSGQTMLGQQKLQAESQMQELLQKATAGDPEAAMKLAVIHGATTGQGPDENTMKAIYMSSTPEQQAKHDQFLKKYNEVTEQPKRESEYVKLLTESPNLQGVYDPKDIPVVAAAWSKGEEIPSTVKANTSLLQQAQIKQQAESLIQSGLNPEIAWSSAEQSVLTGKSIRDTLPAGHKWGASLPEREVAAQESQADTAKAGLDIARGQLGIQKGQLQLAQDEFKGDRVTPNSMPDNLKFLEGMKWDDANHFLDMSAKLKEPENADLKAQLDAIQAFGKALGDKAGSDDQYKAMTQGFMSSVASRFGYRFETEWTFPWIFGTSTKMVGAPSDTSMFAGKPQLLAPEPSAKGQKIPKWQAEKNQSDMKDTGENLRKLYGVGGISLVK